MVVPSSLSGIAFFHFNFFHCPSDLVFFPSGDSIPRFLPIKSIILLVFFFPDPFIPAAQFALLEFTLRGIPVFSLPFPRAEFEQAAVEFLLLNSVGSLTDSTPLTIAWCHSPIRILCRPLASLLDSFLFMWSN